MNRKGAAALSAGISSSVKEPVMQTKDFKVVNQRVLKIDSLGLACGEPVFTDDVDINGLLCGRILWSPYAHARITKIDTKEAKALARKCCATFLMEE